VLGRIATDSICGGRAEEDEDPPEFEFAGGALGLTTVELTLDGEVPALLVAVAENV
jgi:hypothetical protein